MKVTAEEPADSHRVRWAIKLIIIMAILAAALDASYVAMKLPGALRAVSTQLTDGADALRAGETAMSRQNFILARERTDYVQGLLSHPVAWIARSVPVVDDDLDAIWALVGAARELSTAGLIGTETAAALGLGDGQPEVTLYDDGHIDFSVADQLARDLERISSRLLRARAELEASPSANIGTLNEAISRARSEVRTAESTVNNGHTLMRLLSGLFARDTDRRYFLAFQTLNEARGTGGLIGLYGILEAEDGRLRLARVASIRELIPLEAAVRTPDDWFRARYGPFSGLREWQEANMSPDVPAVARVLLAMYAEKTGEKLDGVVTMNGLTLKYLTRAMGPIHGTEKGMVVSPETAEQVMLHDIYQFGEKRQVAFLVSVIRRFWAILRMGDFDLAEMGEAMSEAISSRHLHVYSSEQSEQERIDELDASGGLASLGPNAQLVFHNNFGANKIDYHLRRSVETSIDVLNDGDVRVRTTVDLRNEAPKGVENRLTGNGEEGTPPGVNAMILSVLLPQQAHILAEQTRGPYFRTGSEVGHPVLDFALNIPPGKTRSVSVTYVIEQALKRSAENELFDLTLVPHARAFADTFNVLVRVPPDYELASPESSFTGTLEKSQHLTLVLRRRSTSN